MDGRPAALGTSIVALIILSSCVIIDHSGLPSEVRMYDHSALLIRLSRHLWKGRSSILFSSIYTESRARLSFGTHYRNWSVAIQACAVGESLRALALTAKKLHS